MPFRGSVKEDQQMYRTLRNTLPYITLVLAGIGMVAIHTGLVMV